MQYRGETSLASSGMASNTTREKRTIGHRPTCSCNAASQPGTVLDPFGGSGTTAAVASGNGRNAIAIELNPEYVKLAEDRCGLFCSSNASDQRISAYEAKERKP